MPQISKPVSLSASIVSYQSNLQLLQQALRTFRVAAHRAMRLGIVSRIELWLIDNDSGDESQSRLRVLLNSEFANIDGVCTEVVSGHGNVGYGRGHNLAIRGSDYDYHLVLNPDVVIEEDALAEAVRFMEDHPEVGLLTPAVTDPDGSPQYLCKRYPTVLDLALRGFAPEFIKYRFRVRLDRYEMRDAIGSEPVFDVPIVSGAFMFFRGTVLRQLDGFSDDYFLYFEDFDLSLQAGKVGRIAYVPSVRITHFGGNAAGKGFRHIRLFIRSAFTFYRQHGWKWW